MTLGKYVIETAVKSLALVSVLLAAMEFYIREDSAVRRLAEYLYSYFNSEAIRELPGRVVQKYRDRVLLLSASRAEAKEIAFIIALEALMFVPITIYRYLPSPLPVSRLLNFSPYFYYALVGFSIALFLRAVTNASNPRLVIVAGYVFLFFCFDIFLMSLFFVSMDKVDIINGVEVSGVVFLGLHHLLGRSLALVLVTLIVGFSAALLLFRWLSLFLFWLPRHVRTGIANFTSRTMLQMVWLQAFLLAFIPDARTDTRASFLWYACTLVVVAFVSGLFFYAISRIEKNLLIVTVGLVLALPLCILLLGQLMRVIYGSAEPIDSSALLVFAFLVAPLLLTYIPVLLSSLVSTSVRVAALIFRTREVALRPFAAASIFFALLAAVFELALVQVRFLIES